MIVLIGCVLTRSSVEVVVTGFRPRHTLTILQARTSKIKRPRRPIMALSCTTPRQSTHLCCVCMCVYVCVWVTAPPPRGPPSPRLLGKPHASSATGFIGCWNCIMIRFLLLGADLQHAACRTTSYLVRFQSAAARLLYTALASDHGAPWYVIVQHGLHREVGFHSPQPTWCAAIKPGPA